MLAGMGSLHSLRLYLRPPWLILVALLLAAATRPNAAPPQRAYDLIAEVNALRAAYGLAAYEIDPILMSVAQAQNAWRLSAGVTTHSGPNGSSPRQRAAAAGYGGGATIFISENIADGSGLTPAEAVQWWTGDAPHLNTMIGSNYVHVGAGAGEGGGTWRYTLMAGYISGLPGSGAGQGSSSGSSGSGVGGFIVSTPGPDGSVVHTVRAGETLWTIAVFYKVEIETLRALNDLSPTALLQPGDQLLIQPPATSTATASPTDRPTATPTRTPRPSATPPPPTATPTATPTPMFDFAANPTSRTLVMAGAAMILAGLVLAWQRRSADLSTTPTPPTDS